MGKITRPQIWIICGVLSVIALTTLIFTLNKPRAEEIQAEQTRRDSRQQIADQRGSAELELKNAKKQVAQAKADWGVFDRRFMPRIDQSNVYRGWQQLQRERLTVLGPKLDKFVRSDKSVQVVQAQFQIPAPPDDPNQAISPIFTYSGAVTVSGNFEAILKHVERWNRLDRLALVTGFTLQGNSPQLVGSYNVQIFEFTQDPPAPAPTFPPAAGGTGGGMGGGMGGSMPMGNSGSMPMGGAMPGMSGTPGMSRGGGAATN